MTKVLITGASSGIGLATALELGRAGYKVYATMRNPQRSPELAQRAVSEGLPISVVAMDVDSDQSVAGCFSAVFQQDPRIDVLINNAGVERHGSIEELPMEAFRAAMETNYFGAVRCIRQVLPSMRQNKSGCIINVTSVAGKIAASPFGAYTASKFALEALSEVLAQEMKSFGVRVAIVEPGIIDTPMARAIEVEPPSQYRQGKHFAALFRASLENPAPPTLVSSAIRDIVESDTWKLRHPVGPTAEPFLRWRAGMNDEEWTELNALDTESFRMRIKKDFGLELNLTGDDQYGNAAAVAD